MTCDASLSLGDILLVRCDVQHEEHVAHEATILTETRRESAGSKRTRNLARVSWYDETGTVIIA